MESFLGGWEVFGDYRKKPDASLLRSLMTIITKLKTNIMAVKNTDSGEVHKGYKGGTTNCGFDTNDHPENWVSSNEAITCARYGCKD